MDISLTTLILRIIGVGLMLLCAREFWLTAKRIGNYALKRLAKKVAVGVFFFAVGRFAAAWLDNYIDFGVGICSNLVNYAFWLWILYYAWRNRTKLESNVSDDGTQRISTMIDDILAEMNHEREIVHRSKG